MKSNTSNPFIATALLAIVLLCLTTAAQVDSTDGAYDLSWHTIDGGGGTSTGAAYQLAGTIGQPDAGSMSGGSFELLGGFWRGDAAPVPTCPADIAPQGGDGLVNVSDLLAVINAWGDCPAPPSPCPADFVPPGGNGVVNVSELLGVINNWGVCP